MQRWRALTGLSYDLIHSHYWLSGRLALLFADRWNVPIVSMFHTLAQLKNRVAETAAEREQAVRFEIERRTMAGSDRVVAATEIDRTQILRHYGQQAPIEVIPGGVDLDLFSPQPQDTSATTAAAGARREDPAVRGSHSAAERVGDPAAGVWRS